MWRLARNESFYSPGMRGKRGDLCVPYGIRREPRRAICLARGRGESSTKGRSNVRFEGSLISRAIARVSRGGEANSRDFPYEE